MMRQQRGMAWRIALLGLAALSQFFAPAIASEDHVRMISVCGDHSRQIALDITVEGALFTLDAVCIVDGPGATQRQTYRGQLESSNGVTVLRPVHAAESQGRFKTLVTIDGIAAQVAQIRGRDGRACATVSAKATRKGTVPKRFISANGQWGQSVGYMLDDQCTVLAVSLGNRIAMFRAGQQATFELYGISFKAK